MRNIGIFNETQEKVENLEVLEPLLTYALEVENVDNLEFNVIIINNEEIHKINKEYRGIDRPTDVISFALEDYKDIKYENDYRVLGDIYISIDKVKEQAKEYGHSFERELSYMLVHGFYHLMGYDHIEEEDKKIMRPKEEKILNELKITRE